MNKPTRLHHVNSSIFRPLIQLLPIYTLMGRGIGKRDTAAIVPFERDQSNIAMAHGRLAEEVDTMFYGILRKIEHLNE